MPRGGGGNTIPRLWAIMGPDVTKPIQTSHGDRNLVARDFGGRGSYKLSGVRFASAVGRVPNKLKKGFGGRGSRVAQGRPSRGVLMIMYVWGIVYDVISGRKI